MSIRKKLWLTYAWNDNADRDVDYVAQALERKHLNVHLDRWDIPAGQKLWRKIDEGICDPQKCDAWCIYVTENSLRSPACIEELDYALYRALSERRGDSFPLIGLFPTHVSPAIVPAALKIRRYVSLTEPNWEEAVAYGARNETPPREARAIPQTHYTWHQVGQTHVLELRPRAGVWSAPAVALHTVEKYKLNWVSFGTPSTPTQSPFMRATSGLSFVDEDGNKFELQCFLQDQATPTTSMYLHFTSLPNALVIGNVEQGRQLAKKLVLMQGRDVSVS